MPKASDGGLVVVDASVAVKWYLRDEDLTETADIVLDEYSADRVTFIVPDHFQIEVGNAVRNAARSQRLTLESARLAISALTSLAIPMVAAVDLLTAGFDTALGYDCALYDALYLALAEAIGLPIHPRRPPPA